MNRVRYLSQPLVQDFVHFLGGTFRNDPGFEMCHQYRIETRGRGTRTVPWCCANLLEAQERYSWRFTYTDLPTRRKLKGRTFSDSKRVLDQLSAQLRDAVARGAHSQCFEACHQILDWGGVLGSEERGNKKHLLSFGTCLCAYLRETKRYFESPTCALKNDYTVVIEGQVLPLHMNSGFTKIYALLCDDFMIYDGRVGAAMGLLVKRFYAKNRSKQHLAEALSFRYGMARTAKVNRDPSNNQCRFPALSHKSAPHIRSNLMANWVVTETLKADCGGFSGQPDPMRAVEAALFMVGYRIDASDALRL